MTNAASGLMTTAELAEYLRLNERTVLKLAAQGELPGVRLGNQWRFRKAVLDAWLDDQMLGVRSAGGEGRAPTSPTFAFDSSFQPEHVLEQLEGRTMPAVLAELAAKAHALGLIRDKTWFLGALLERENILSSVVGEGVAFPHTLERHPDQVRLPFLLLGRSPQGVTFGEHSAPVQLIILMGLRYQQLHLPWLRRLSRVLKKRRLREKLLAAADGAAICALLHQELVVRGAGREPGIDER